MNIMIAGGGGIIGSFLSLKLTPKAFITVIDNIPVGKNNSVALDLSNNIETINYVNKCDKIDVLIFLVGRAHSKGKGKDYSMFERSNYQTLVNLMSAFEKYGKIPKKIIFASTIAVYGERSYQIIYKENLTTKPFSPYAVTKLMAEQYLLKKFENRSWILRFAPVYSSDFLLNINRRTKISGMFYRVGSGNKKLSLCNIENIKIAIKGIIQGDVPPGIYNLSDTSYYTYNDLLECQNAKRVIGIPPFSVKFLLQLGNLSNNTFIKENCVKLLSDNIFPSDKIRSYIDLPASLGDIKLSNDK